MNKLKIQGQSLVEFALILPILLLLFLGIAEGAHIVQSYLSAQAAVREAARYAVAGQPWLSEITGNPNGEGVPSWGRDERINFILDKAGEHSRGTGYYEIITDTTITSDDFLLYQNDDTCDQDTCAGIIGIRAGRERMGINDVCDDAGLQPTDPQEWCWGNAGEEGDRLRVELYHNVAIFDPIYEVIVPNGFLRVGGAIVMKNEGGPPIGGEPEPEEDNGYPPPPAPGSNLPIIKTQASSYPAGSTAIILLEQHDPNTVYEVWVNGVFIGTATTDASGNAIMQYVVPLDWLPGAYTIQSQLGGSAIATGQLWVTQSTTPLIALTGGDIWPYGSILEYSLVAHPSNTTFDMDLTGPNTADLGQLSTDNNGASLTSTYTMEPYTTGWADGNYIIQSAYTTGTIAATRTVTFRHGCIKIDQGNCGEEQTLPKMTPFNILISNHAANRAYVLRFNGATQNFITNYAGEAFIPSFVPDVANGVYEILTEDATNLGTTIARNTINVSTPAGPYINVLGGYTWPAGSNILFHLRQHLPTPQLYDVYWIDPTGTDAPILIVADKVTDADGNAEQDFIIPKDIQGEYQIVSVEPGGDPTDAGDIVGVSLANVTVTSQAYLEIAEGNPQIPGATITVLVRNHAVNNQYDIYIGGGPEANVPGTLMPGNPVTTDQNGHTEIVYTIPPNIAPGQSLLIRSYLISTTNNFVAETTLDLAAADLIITSIEIPASPQLNAEVPLTITVYNDSPVTITHKSFDVDLYLDPVQTPDLGRTLPPGDRKSWVQPNFPAYGTTVLTSSLQIYGTDPHDVWGRVDTSNRISEGTVGETNNLYHILLQASGCEIEYTTNIFDPANYVLYGDADPGVSTDPEPRLRIYTAGGDVNAADDGAAGHYLAYRTMTATITAPPVGGVLIDATFDNDEESFSYLDDTFNGTNNGAFADGSWGSSFGDTGGGLRVQIGGTVGGSNDNPQYDMSGGWRQSFNLGATSPVQISFKYRLDQDIEYDDDEYSLVKLTVDGTEYGNQSATGNDTGTNEGLMVDECERGCNTGWQTFNIIVPGLSSGSHNFTIGGFNNRKTSDNELTEVYIDDVQVTQLTSLVSASFDSDSQGFTYADDTFRGTNQPNYASGAWGGSYGNSGGGLRVQVGGINNANIDNMSGGWSYTFNLAADAEVVMGFDYNMDQDNEYDNGERSQVLMSIDGTLVGQGSNDYILQYNSGGQSDWRNFSANLGTLTAGNHTVIIGAYNNRKTYNNEETIVDFDNVTVAMVGAPSTGPGTPTSSFEIQARLIATDTAVTGGWGIEVRKGITDTAAKVDLGYSTAGNIIGYVQRANNGAPSAGALQTGVAHPGTSPIWVRLVKTGGDFTLYTATDNGTGHTNWGSATPFSVADLTGEVLVGLFGSSLDGTTLGLYDFDNVKICTANTDCATAGDIIYEAPDGFSAGSTANLSGQGFGSAIASNPYHEVVDQVPPQPPTPVTISGDTITLTGTGSGTANDTNEGYLHAYHQIDGNFDVQIELTSHQPLTAGTLRQFALAGLEVRANLTDNADKLDWTSMYLSPSERRLYWQTRENNSTNDQVINTTNQSLPVWLRIIRDEDDFTLYYSYDTSSSPPPDDSWVEQTTLTMSGLPDSVYLGLINASTNADEYTEAVFNGYHVCGNQGGIASCGEVREANGMVVIDAGNEVANIIRTREWTTTARSGMAGFVVADNGDNFNGSNYTTNSPELQYAVDFTNLGTYYVWILGYGPHSNSNSIHFGLSNSPPPSGNNMSSNASNGSMDWFNTRQNGSTRHTVDITSVGSNSLSVWMREDGFEIYKILLTTDENFTPSTSENYAQSTCSSFGQPDVPPGMRQCTDLITNGDFESGDSPWNFLTLAEQVTRTSSPHYFGPNQNWSLLLPATNIGGLPRQPWVYQDVQMPGWVLTPTTTGGTSLIFSAHVAVNPEGADQPDPLYVTLRDQTGQAHESSLTTLYELANGAQTPPINPAQPDPENTEWSPKRINLADYFPSSDDILDYAGQPLRLFIESPNASGTYSTRFSIDNINFEACTTQPTPENPSTLLGGQVWILRNGTPQPQTGVNVWAYAIDGTLAKTYTIHDTTFSFYNLPADPDGTQYIIYAEYFEDNTLKIASAIRKLFPGDRIEDIILLLN